MRSVGIRELKEHTSRILQRVHQKGEEIEVTHRGRPIARLIPVARRRPVEKASSAAWSDLDRVAAEIGAHWPGRVTATDAVREGRREL